MPPCLSALLCLTARGSKMSCSSIRSTITLCVMCAVGHSVLLKVTHGWISIINTGYFQISHQTRSGVSRFYLENVAHLSVNRKSRQQVKQNRMYLTVITIVYTWEEALQVCQVKLKEVWGGGEILWGTWNHSKQIGKSLGHVSKWQQGSTKPCYDADGQMSCQL